MQVSSTTAWQALEINRLNFGADVTIAISPLEKFKFLALLQSQSNQHLVVIQLHECIAVVQSRLEHTIQCGYTALMV